MKKLVQRDGTILFENISAHPPDQKKIRSIIKKYKNKSSQSELLSVRVPDYLNEMLKTTAEIKGISYSDYVRNLLTWPFMVHILEDSLKSGNYSSKLEAELSIKEELERIDLFLSEVGRVRDAENIVNTIKDRLERLIVELKAVVFDGILSKGLPKTGGLPSNGVISATTRINPEELQELQNLHTEADKLENKKRKVKKPKK